jgi:serine/threonine protein kinase
MNNIILKHHRDAFPSIVSHDVIVEFILVPEQQCGDLQPVELSISSIKGVENNLLSYRTFDLQSYCEYIIEINNAGAQFSNAYRKPNPVSLEDNIKALKPDMLDSRTLFSLSNFTLRPTNISICGKRLFYTTAKMDHCNTAEGIFKYAREGEGFVKHLRTCNEADRSGVYYPSKLIGFTFDNDPDICFKPFLNIFKGYLSIRDNADVSPPPVTKKPDNRFSVSEILKTFDLSLTELARLINAELRTKIPSYQNEPLTEKEIDFIQKAIERKPDNVYTVYELVKHAMNKKGFDIYTKHLKTDNSDISKSDSDKEVIAENALADLIKLLKGIARDSRITLIVPRTPSPEAYKD